VSRRRYEGLKVRLDRQSGEVNLRVSYGDLRQVFTAAALHCYDSLEKRKKDPGGRAGSRREADAYDNGLLAFVRGIEALLEEELLPRRTGPMTVEERRKAAIDSKRERQLFDDMLSAMRAERVSRA